MLPTDDGVLMLSLEWPVSVEELHCRTIDELARHLARHIGE